MKKQFFIISLIILSFGFFKVTFAYSIIQQLNDSNSDTLDFSSAQPLQTFGNNLSGTIENLKIKLKADTVISGHFAIQLYQATTSATSSIIFTDANLIYEWRQSITTTTIQNYTLTTSTAYYATSSANAILNSSKYYSIIITKSGGGNATIYGSTNANSFLNGFATNRNGGSWTNLTTLNDLYFQLNMHGDIPSAISITYPTNGTSTADFSSWNVYASGEIAKVKINYADNFSSYTDQRDVFSTTNGYINIPILKSHQLAVSTSTFYSATPYILDINNNIIASGTTIYFQINQNFSTTTSAINWQNFLNTLVDNGVIGVNTYSNIGFNLPHPGASTTAQCFWNSSPMDCIINGLYGFAVTLFTPHDISLNAIRSQLTQFNSIFPFSVPLTLIQSLQADASSTPTAQTLTLPIILGNNSTSVTLLNASSAENIIGTTAKNQYFSVIRLLLYAATGVVMVVTIL